MVLALRAGFAEQNAAVETSTTTPPPLPTVSKAEVLQPLAPPSPPRAAGSPPPTLPTAEVLQPRATAPPAPPSPLFVSAVVLPHLPMVLPGLAEMPLHQSSPWTNIVLRRPCSPLRGCDHGNDLPSRGSLAQSRVLQKRRAVWCHLHGHQVRCAWRRKARGRRARRRRFRRARGLLTVRAAARQRRARFVREAVGKERIHAVFSARHARNSFFLASRAKRRPPGATRLPGLARRRRVLRAAGSRLRLAVAARLAGPYKERHGDRESSFMKPYPHMGWFLGRLDRLPLNFLYF